jgi:hypothetical protein
VSHPAARKAPVSSCLTLPEDRMIVPLATGVLQFETLPGDAGVRLDAPWAGAGPGTVNVASDGTTGQPRFEYHVHAEAGEWTFQTSARSRRIVSVAWSYTGFHAWFDVRVKLERFVRRGDGEVARETLVKAGVVHGGLDPSGGFTCSGMSSFDVLPGDVYGFRMSGRNVDF